MYCRDLRAAGWGCSRFRNRRRLQCLSQLTQGLLVASCVCCQSFPFEAAGGAAQCCHLAFLNANFPDMAF